MKKVLTAKKYRQAIIIDNDIIVRKQDGTFNVYEADITSTIDPLNPPAHLPGYYDTLKTLIEFDESPFVIFYNEWKEKREKNRLQKIEDAKIAEEKRITNLKLRIENCETPIELVNEFGLTCVDTARHWSDMYTGRSSQAILICNREEFEIMELAKDIHDADGDYGETKHRAGEHHSTFSSMWGGLEEYQEALARYFGGDKFFYKSPEVDADYFTNDMLKDILEDEDLNDFEKMESISKLCKTWEEIEPGYYDCNGNLEMSDEDLSDPDLSGYSSDVYTYHFAFNFNHKYNWKEEIEEENDENED